ncbi:unannotated protein [freshwater metagenome]|uniref:Unannotated protein n=1 Tax=freshwater metagenome TaxID=449393 RepID=A0A6J7Q762_9ZZZZ
MDELLGCVRESLDLARTDTDDSEQLSSDCRDGSHVKASAVDIDAGAEHGAGVEALGDREVGQGDGAGSQSILEVTEQVGTYAAEEPIDRETGVEHQEADIGTVREQHECLLRRAGDDVDGVGCSDNDLGQDAAVLEQQEHPHRVDRIGKGVEVVVERALRYPGTLDELRNRDAACIRIEEKLLQRYEQGIAGAVALCSRRRSHARQPFLEMTVCQYS